MLNNKSSTKYIFCLDGHHFPDNYLEQLSTLPVWDIYSPEENATTDPRTKKLQKHDKYGILYFNVPQNKAEVTDLLSAAFSWSEYITTHMLPPEEDAHEFVHRMGEQYILTEKEIEDCYTTSFCISMFLEGFVFERVKEKMESEFFDLRDLYD